MADIPHYYFTRSVLAGGLVLTVLAYYAAAWVNGSYFLQKQEAAVVFRFKNLKKYEEALYLPEAEFLDNAGKPVTFADYQGKYLLLNVWATWCTPCVKELPSLQKLSRILADDKKWKVMAISIDQKENLDKVAQFMDRYRVGEVASYYDYKSEIQKKVQISQMPTTFIINQSGRVVYEITGGAMWHEAEVVKFLRLVPEVY